MAESSGAVTLIREKPSLLPDHLSDHTNLTGLGVGISTSVGIGGSAALAALAAPAAAPLLLGIGGAWAIAGVLGTIATYLSGTASQFSSAFSQVGSLGSARGTFSAPACGIASASLGDFGQKFDVLDCVSFFNDPQKFIEYMEKALERMSTSENKASGYLESKARLIDPSLYDFSTLDEPVVALPDPPKVTSAPRNDGERRDSIHDAIDRAHENAVRDDRPMNGRDVSNDC